MTTKSFYGNHFDSIQALRGMASIFIILEHVRFLQCGAFGVDIFFAISGFMIMYSTHENTEFFLRKRLLRILPLYYLMTLGTFVLLLLVPSMFEQTQANPIYLMKSLLFIPFDIGGGVLQPLMRVGWTVNCEMFFYLLFFFALRISHKYRGVICAGFLMVIVLLAQILPLDFAPLTFYGNPVMLEFVLGMISYAILHKLYEYHAQKGLPSLCKPLSLLLSIGLFAGLVLSKPHINILGFRRILYWGLPGVILLLCFFVMGLYWRMPGWSVMPGNISFSVYLIHYYPVLFLDRVVFDFSAASPFSLIGVVVSVVICVGAGWLCWFLIEKKLTGFLRRHLLPQR